MMLVVSEEVGKRFILIDTSCSEVVMLQYWIIFVKMGERMLMYERAMRCKQFAGIISKVTRGKLHISRCGRLYNITP